MPRIDPLQLLSCLKVLLASNGGIRSANEVKRLAGLMTKYSKKLVSKCIYIQILKCTNTELLGQFMGAGGWSLTHMWLSEGIRAMNWPLVQEILELLLLCPVDVQRLRSNSAPKLVKGLCKDGGNEGVRILATKLVEQWLKVVKGETMASPENVQQSSTSSTEIKESESKKSNTFLNSTTNIPSETSVISENNDVEQDPLAIPEIAITNNNNQLHVSASPSTKSTISSTSTTTTTTKNADSALVYKIVLKDGKQILAKIENSPSAIALDNNKLENLNNSNNLDENKETIDDRTIDDKLISDKISNKENEKDKSKESESKSNLENKETKETTDNKSRNNNSSSGSSSKDKDKHRDHKSSSSSHRSSSSKSRISGSSSSSSSKSKSSHRNSTESSSSKNRDKDSSSTSSKDRDSDKHKSSSSSSKTSGSCSSGSKDKDKHRDRDKHRISSSDKDKIHEKDNKEKEKTNQAEKDKDTLSKLTPPSIDKLGKIPRKPKDDSNAAPVTSITIPSKKASMSIEIRKDSENRPKTVKTYKSQFRSHGLSEEAPPPPSRKGLKKPLVQSLPGTSIPPSLSGLNLKRSSPPPPPIPSPQQQTAGDCSPTKDTSQPIEKKVKIDLTSTAGTEKVGAIKLIAPKPKPSLLVESDMFMDALSASAHPKKDSRKRKRRSSNSKEPGKDGANSPPESPNTTISTSSSSSSSSKVAPLKFYQDTLEDEEKAENNEENRDEERKDDEKREDEDDIPLKRVKEEIEEKVRQEKQEEERLVRETESPEEQVKKPPGPGCGPNGPPGVLMLHRRKGPKKKLKWRVQEELEEVRFFELDETERVNVTKTFTDMKQMERFNEREAFLMARKLNCEDVMCEQTAWMPLIMVDEVPSHPEGSQSKEKKIQSEREQTTLKALYFTRHMIPDSASEPDMEQYQIIEPAVIPLDDITGNPDAVNDFTNMPWPDPKGSPPPGSDDFMQQDVPFPSGPFNPFMPFNNQNVWQMGPSGAPNGVIQPNMMGNFNNMNMQPQNMPPNLLSFPPPDDMQMKMNMMQPPFVGPPPNFGGPMNNPGPGFNNFGGPPGLNMNPNIKMNMNNNGPRGIPPGGMGRGGWRSGGPPNNNTGGGGNWRPQGPATGPRNNWVHGNNNRICKQFQRGFCRNGSKCNYVHPPNNNF